MANYCDFIMRITGRKENVDELIEMMNWEGRYKNKGLGRIYECLEGDTEELNEEFVTTEVSGYCAWSVLTAMRRYDERSPSLESETERLGLLVEYYSTEPGMGFQEHGMIDKGEVVLDDCVDYTENCIEDFGSVKEFNEEFGTNFTEDMVQDGYIYEGGYGDDYGYFKTIEIENL